MVFRLIFGEITNVKKFKKKKKKNGPIFLKVQKWSERLLGPGGVLNFHFDMSVWPIEMGIFEEKSIIYGYHGYLFLPKWPSEMGRGFKAPSAAALHELWKRQLSLKGHWTTSASSLIFFFKKEKSKKGKKILIPLEVFTYVVTCNFKSFTKKYTFFFPFLFKLLKSTFKKEFF